MAQHNELGSKGEKIAIEYLTKNNYSILKTNWRFNKAEIDIIALCPKKEYVVFVEVKTRNSDFFGEPHLAVKAKKRNNIILAANEFIKQYNYDLESRFDIISIILNQKTMQLEHIEEAFWARP
jgi:putative endonuclease